MFDKLVESNLTGADLKPRRKIFAVTFVFVGLLFVTAVVAGIYAADYGLGTDSFDIAELLSPIAQAEPTEEPEPRQQPRDNQQNTSDIPTRQIATASTSDPTKVPIGISTEKYPYRSIPDGKYKIAPGPERDGSSQETNLGKENGTGSGPAKIDEGEDTTTPPPAAAPKVNKPRGPVSGGVLTGKAKVLPQPAYPPAAKAVGASGSVTVQITIDETGKVISVKAVNGNIMLRPAAEQAAWKARFDPTTLTGVPVKVTGIITYNFVR